MSPSPADLIATAALTITDGRGLSGGARLRAIRGALLQGWRAARRGRALPLPVLLDVAAAFATPRPAWPSYRARSNWTGQERYRTWFQSFTAHLPGHLTARPTLRDGSSCPEPDYLESLLQNWPATPKEDQHSLHWAQAYAELLSDDDACAQIRAQWTGVRDASKALRDRWGLSVLPDRACIERPDQDCHAPSAYWDLFARLPDRDQLHERFDHDAARTFVDALAPEFPADQEAAIALARQREQIKLDPPTGYDTMNPYRGETTLATLCQGAYGDWKRVNRSDIRISDEDPTLPLWTVEIHVCWAHGYTGLSRTHPDSRFRDHADRVDTEPGAVQAVQGTGLTTEASILQGVIALLLDDWRVMLRDLPVEFYAHRGPPPSDLKTDGLGPGGERWTVRAEGRDQRPPSKVVDRFFERCTWDTSGAWSLRWKTPPAAQGWWCAVLLHQDLHEFGFCQLPASPPEAGQAGEGWRASGEALPDCISHLITVVPPDQGGRIFEVQRGRDKHGDQELELHPVAGREGVPQGPDPSFRALRILALDLALDVLCTVGV